MRKLRWGEATDEPRAVKRFPKWWPAARSHGGAAAPPYPSSHSADPQVRPAISGRAGAAAPPNLRIHASRVDETALGGTRVSRVEFGVPPNSEGERSFISQSAFPRIRIVLGFRHDRRPAGGGCYPRASARGDARPTGRRNPPRSSQRDDPTWFWWVGKPRCGVPVAERSVRRRNSGGESPG